MILKKKRYKDDWLMPTKYFMSNFVFIFWNDYGTLIILIIFILIEHTANYSIILLRIKVSLEWKKAFK